LHVIVDASFRDGLGTTAYVSALIGRRALTRRYQSSTEAELAAVLQAMHAARAVAIPRMILATDCELAALVARPRRAQAAGLWREIRSLMVGHPGWLLCYTRGENVKDAHRLATGGLRRAHQALRQAEDAPGRRRGGDCSAALRV
jgi:ribonuclease HI